jgi:5-methylcytosine-specific restriction endonuclease McrA
MKKTNDENKPGPFAGKRHNIHTKELIKKHHAHYWQGKKLSNAHKAKISAARRSKFSEREMRYEIYKLIIKRDRNCCKLCGTFGTLKIPFRKGLHGNLVIFHKDSNKTNLTPSNLLTVCLTCNQGLNK